MRMRIVILIIAVILAVIAVVTVIGYISNIRASVEEEVEKIEVLIAAQNIPGETQVETIIADGSVITEAIPRKYLAEGVLTSLEDYKGYIAAVPINKGEQITATKLIKPEDIGLAFMIPDDMVAISIPVNEVIGVSNLINVGDRVNVIATFKPTEEQPITVYPEAEEALEEIRQEITKTLLWNVEVLYLGTWVEITQTTEQPEEILGAQTEERARKSEITTVTLAVTPEDSEKLVFTEEMGSVWLALLPTKEIEREETFGRTFDNIFE
ncbi:MAG: Flp pilus assembly protein CpaB [Candidatus Humimicrobiia bacterium]